MTAKSDDPRDASITDEQQKPGVTGSGGRKDGLARLGIGVLLLSAGTFLWLNPEMLRFLVASQRPGGIGIPFFTAAGTLIWLLAPYALMIGGIVVAVRGAWQAIFGSKVAQGGSTPQGGNR